MTLGVRMAGGLLARLTLLTAAISALLALLARCNLPVPSTDYRVVLSISSGLAVLIDYVYDVYLHPFCWSPLRRLPTVRSGFESSVFLENPRGKTLLKWIRANPDAQVIRSVGRVGETLLFPVGPAALRDVLATNADDFVKPYGGRYYISRGIGWGMITAEGDTHRHQRRSLTPSFTLRNLRRLYPSMWSKARVLLDKLEAFERAPLEVSSWASRYALDVIGSAALSHDFHAMDLKEAHPISTALANVQEPQGEILYLAGLTFVAPPSWVHSLPLHANRVMDRECETIRSIAAEILDNKRHSLKRGCDGDQGNILGDLVRDYSLPPDAVVDQIRTIVAAGHETSAATISWAIHLLSQPENAHCQERVRREVRHACSSALDSAALEQLLETSPYLNGVTEEALRLYPAISITAREAVCDTTVAGTLIPSGSLVMIIPYSVNRHPKFWGSDAEQFRPERWIDVLPDGSKRVNKHGGAGSNYNNITFLHGPRSCIGRDFARAQVKAALAAVFGRYEVSQRVGDSRQARAGGILVNRPLDGIWINLKRVEGW